MEVSDDLLEAMGHPSVCPHLHLPLQSGDDDVLHRMGRRYTAEEFLDVVRRARDKLQSPSITTDVMVGFPGETDEEFNNTLQFCREVGFSRIHVFKYSPRKGTPAAEMKGQVHSRVANERSLELRRLADEMSARWAGRFVGEHVRVLLEEDAGDGAFAGYTDRYVRVLVDSGGCREGEMRNVLVEGVEGGGLRGTVLRSD
jgi:threonylcarbamoyladenosine tRNA methylthiotransferase MtaB